MGKHRVSMYDMKIELYSWPSSYSKGQPLFMSEKLLCVDWSDLHVLQRKRAPPACHYPLVIPLHRHLLLFHRVWTKHSHSKMPFRIQLMGFWNDTDIFITLIFFVVVCGRLLSSVVEEDMQFFYSSKSSNTTMWKCSDIQYSMLIHYKLKCCMYK